MSNVNIDNNGSAAFSANLKNGFRLMDGATKQGTQGVQTLAFSAMLGHELAIADEKEVADWAALVGSAKAVTAFMNLLLDYAEIVKPIMPKGEKVDTILVDQKAYAAHCTALRRGIALAAELVTHGVDSSFYVTKSKMFAVPAVMLCGYGEETTGRLGKMEKEDKNVLLDGLAYYIEREDKMVSINASVSQVMKAMKSIREGGNALSQVDGSEGMTGATDDRANAGQGDTGKVWNNLDFEGCVIEAAKIIKSDELPVKWSELDTKAQNALEMLRMFIEQAKALDVLEPEDKKTADKAA